MHCITLTEFLSLKVPLPNFSTSFSTFHFHLNLYIRAHDHRFLDSRHVRHLTDDRGYRVREVVYHTGYRSRSAGAGEDMLLLHILDFPDFLHNSLDNFLYIDLSADHHIRYHGRRGYRRRDRPEVVGEGIHSRIRDIREVAGPNLGAEPGEGQSKSCHYSRFGTMAVDHLYLVENPVHSLSYPLCLHRSFDVQAVHPRDFDQSFSFSPSNLQYRCDQERVLASEHPLEA